MTRPSRYLPVAACIAVAAVAAGCGKKGPPLAPLHLVPDVMKEVAVKRSGDAARIRFVLPTANLNGPGPIQLDRVEIYAVTAAPGAILPRERDLLTATYRVGTIPVRPVPVEGEPPPPPDAAPDPRPGPGETVQFSETLTPDKLTPAKLRFPPVPKTPPVSTTAPAISPVVPEVALPTYPVRVYVIRGLTKSGRGGQPSAPVRLPLVDLPAPPADLTADFTETATTLAWSDPPPSMPEVATVMAASVGPAALSMFAAAPAPAAASVMAAAAPATAPRPMYNVYEGDAPQPLNAVPLLVPAFEWPGARFDEEHCFTVRTVTLVATFPIESVPSASSCVTPKDIFPPAAPKGLSAVPTAGAMNLSWQANTDADLAGYVVLRGEAPGDRLQQLTPEPITNTRYEDKTARAGVRYVYVVVAVDRATPPNTSAQSNRVEETAR